MRYERPVVIATYSVEKLRAEAGAVACASIVGIVSDRNLKTDIRRVDDPLKRLDTL
jgi:hypothetical protein